MIALLIAASLLAQPEQIPALALEVKNPRATGRRIFHFEDVIGPEARAIAGHKPARAMLIFSMSPPNDDEEGAAAQKTLEALAELERGVRQNGGAVVVVLLTSAGKERSSEKHAIDPERWPFAITADPHGFARRRLGLTGQGRALVVRSDGRIVAAYGPEPSALERARAAFQQLLEEVSQ